MKHITKFRMSALFLAAVLVLLWAEGTPADSSGTSDAAGAPRDWQEFIGKNASVSVGTIFDGVLQEYFTPEEVLYFDDYVSSIEAVHVGKAEFSITDELVAEKILKDERYSDLETIPVPRDMFDSPIGAISVDQGMIDAYNTFLLQIKADGTLKEMTDRWLYSDNPVMPDIPLSGENGTLIVATDGTTPLWSFSGNNGSLAGFEIEHMTRFAEYLGKDVQFETMAFAGLIPYVVSGKAHIGAADITITEERKKSVMFTDPYFDSGAVVVMKKAGASLSASPEEAPGEPETAEDHAEAKTGDESKTGFIKWLKDGVQKNLIQESLWKLIVSGINVTLTISVAALLIGTVLGCLICFMLTRKRKWAKIPAYIYNAIIRGLPIVVLLMVFYYIVFGKSGVSPVIVAIVAFSLVEGAGIGSNLKGAIDTVDIVQIEAARSIGFTAFGAFKRVALPQAIKVVLPGYLSGFVELVKGTAIVGYIAIQDLSRAGDIIRSRTYDAYFPILFVALVYLAITATMVLVFKLIIRRVTK